MTSRLIKLALILITILISFFLTVRQPTFQWFLIYFIPVLFFLLLASCGVYHLISTKLKHKPARYILLILVSFAVLFSGKIYSEFIGVSGGPVIIQTTKHVNKLTGKCEFIDLIEGFNPQPPWYADFLYGEICYPPQHEQITQNISQKTIRVDQPSSFYLSHTDSLLLAEIILILLGAITILIRKFYLRH